MPDTVSARKIQTDLAAGDFDNPSWEQAAPVYITRLWSGEQVSELTHAEVGLLWSEHGLHLKFMCNQHQPLVINSDPQLAEKTIGLWNRDVCEVFLAPDSARPRSYFEFEAAPTGEWVDLAIDFSGPQRKNDFEFESGMKSAVRLDNNQVMIGMLIPWSTRIPCPQVGDVWRANLFRCAGVGNDRYLAWQPTFTLEPNFHVPSAFGRLLFI